MRQSFTDFCMADRLSRSLLLSVGTFRHGTTAKLSFVVLHEMDILLTLCAVSVGLSELNPLMVRLLGVPVSLLAVKVVLPVFIAWLVPGKLLLPAILISLFMLIWNIKEFILFAI